MTCDGARGGERSIYALLIHEAAHAVVAWETGARLGRVFVDRERRCGNVAFSSDAAIGRFAQQSPLHRAAAERDMLIFHAGSEAEKRFKAGELPGYPIRDYSGVFEAAQRFTADRALIDAWSAFIQERARCLIERPATWARIVALALKLARDAQPSGVTELDGDAVDCYLATVRVPRTNAYLAYRRREAKELFVLFEKETARRRFCRTVDDAYARQNAGGSGRRIEARHD